jgi:hypothetical protein
MNDHWKIIHDHKRDYKSSKKIFNRNFTFHNESKFAFISLERDEICGGPETDVRGPEAEALCFPPHAK